MIMVAFVTVFPELGAKETRCVTIFNDDEVPRGEYGLIELYCPDVDCDCRKVDIYVLNQNGDVFARLSCGWETKEFYDNYFGQEYAKTGGLPGPGYAPLQPQGQYSEFFLKFLRQQWADADYKARVKRHYAMIKEEATKRDLL